MPIKLEPRFLVPTNEKSQKSFCSWSNQCGSLTTLGQIEVGYRRSQFFFNWRHQNSDVKPTSSVSVFSVCSHK